MAVDGRALAATGVGILLVWSGIKGWSVTSVVTDVVKGQRPQPTSTLRLVSTAEGDGLPSGGDSGSIVDVALSYVGHAYSFGGAPGTSGDRPWDCSSFVNYVVGVRLGQPIPGHGPGAYKGTTHGPTTAVWAAWVGMNTVRRSEVRAGDIIVWVGHMGIATSPTHMVSALNPADRTKVTPIDGYGNGPLVRIGRLR